AEPGRHFVAEYAAGVLLVARDEGGVSESRAHSTLEGLLHSYCLLFPSNGFTDLCCDAFGGKTKALHKHGSGAYFSIYVLDAYPAERSRAFFAEHACHGVSETAYDVVVLCRYYGSGVGSRSENGFPVYRFDG